MVRPAKKSSVKRSPANAARNVKKNIKRDSTAAPAVMSVKTALKAALRSAFLADGIDVAHRAWHLDDIAEAGREAQFCVLAKNCEDRKLVKRVKALCKAHSIPLMKVSDKTLLGEWCGLCKCYPADNASKDLHVVGWVIDCACAVVRDYGRDELAKIVLQHHFNSKK